MTASLLGASFEAFVLDDEMHSKTYRALRGIEVSEENLGFDAITEAVLDAGHFLGGDHTIAAMERHYFYPSLADRSEPRTWAEDGAKDAWTVANVRVREILKDHHPQYLTTDQDAAIRSQFNFVRPYRFLTGRRWCRNKHPQFKRTAVRCFDQYPTLTSRFPAAQNLSVARQQPVPITVCWLNFCVVPPFCVLIAEALSFVM